MNLKIQNNNWSGKKTIFGIILAETEDCLQIVFPVGLENLTSISKEANPNISNVNPLYKDINFMTLLIINDVTNFVVCDIN